MSIDVVNELEKACASQVAQLFGTFWDGVAAAKDKDAAIDEGAKRLKNGLDLLKRVLARAREVAGS